MAEDTSTAAPARPPGPLALAAAILGAALLILAVSAALVFFQNTRRAENTNLVSERLAKLKEIRGQEDKALVTYAWADKEKQLAKLPIERAMETVLPALQSRRVEPSDVRAPLKSGPSDMPADPLPGAAAPAAVPAEAAPAENATPAPVDASSAPPAEPQPTPAAIP